MIKTYCEKIEIKTEAGKEEKWSLGNKIGVKLVFSHFSGAQ